MLQEQLILEALNSHLLFSKWKQFKFFVSLNLLYCLPELFHSRNNFAFAGFTRCTKLRFTAVHLQSPGIALPTGYHPETFNQVFNCRSRVAVLWKVRNNLVLVSPTTQFLRNELEQTFSTGCRSSRRHSDWITSFRYSKLSADSSLWPMAFLAVYCRIFLQTPWPATSYFKWAFLFRLLKAPNLLNTNITTLLLSDI